jgi:hypothetical protein
MCKRLYRGYVITPSGALQQRQFVPLLCAHTRLMPIAFCNSPLKAVLRKMAVIGKAPKACMKSATQCTTAAHRVLHMPLMRRAA